MFSVYFLPVFRSTGSIFHYTSDPAKQQLVVDRQLYYMQYTTNFITLGYTTHCHFDQIWKRPCFEKGHSGKSQNTVKKTDEIKWKLIMSTGKLAGRQMFVIFIQDVPGFIQETMIF